MFKTQKAADNKLNAIIAHIIKAGFEDTDGTFGDDHIFAMFPNDYALFVKLEVQQVEEKEYYVNVQFLKQTDYDNAALLEETEIAVFDFVTVADLKEQLVFFKEQHGKENDFSVYFDLDVPEAGNFKKALMKFVKKHKLSHEIDAEDGIKIVIAGEKRGDFFKFVKTVYMNDCTNEEAAQAVEDLTV